MLTDILIWIIIFIISVYVIVATIIFIYGKRRINIMKDYNYRPTVTVFIPTYNEERNIARKLDELLRQSYPINEILVIDCSNDRTPEIVSEYARYHPNIKLVRQNTRIGMARTLNQAIDTATGDILVKTDADTYIFSDDAIKEVIACFGDPNIGAVTVSRINNKIDMEDKYAKFLTIIQIAESNIDSTVIGMNSILAFRRSVMVKVDPESMAEDTEELVRIRRKGYRTIIEPSVITEEEIPMNMRLRRIQKDRRAEGIIRVLLNNIDMLFNPLYNKYGMLVLPLEFFVLIVSPFLSITLASIIIYLTSLYSSLFSILVVAGISIPYIVKRTLLSAFIDVNISGLIAVLRAMKRPEPLWERVR